MLNSHATKLILYANQQQLLAGVFLNRKLQSRFIFNNGPPGHLACAALLEKYRASHVYLIADAREEDYRVENLPHTQGKTKRDLIARKLNQLYRGLDYRAAHFLHRQKDKRQDDSYLFIALNNAQFLQNWLTLMQAADSLLVGIYPVSLLSPLLFKQASKQPVASHTLLCEPLSTGLRQSYLHQGQLQLSRLVASTATPASVDFYQEEIEKMRLYLLSQHLLSSETNLAVVLATAAADVPNLARPPDKQASPYTHMHWDDYAKTKQLACDLIVQTPELLHMQLIADGQLVANLAPDKLRKPYQLSRLKHTLHKMTAAIAVLGVLLTGLLFYQGAQDQAALKTSAEQIALVQASYREYAKKFPAYDYAGQQLKAATRLDVALAHAAKSPRRIMQAVSAALEQSPRIHLKQLTWQLNHDRSMQGGQSLAPLQEIAFINGELTGDNADTPDGKIHITNFIAQLQKNPAVASVALLATEAHAPSPLTGNTLDEKNPAPATLPFKVQVVFKLAHASPASEVK